MGKRKPQHKRFGHKKHEHKNKYAEFSHADENLREQEARSEKLKRQAEEAERKRKIQESVPWWQRDSFGGSGGIRYYQSFSQYLLEDNFHHLPYERYRARSLIEIV